MKNIILNTLILFFVFFIVFNACVDKRVYPAPCSLLVSEYSRKQCDTSNIRCETLKEKAKLQFELLKKQGFENKKECEGECFKLCKEILCEMGEKESCKN